MKILYLHQYFVPPEGSGGTRSYELASRLVAAGHEVTLITSSGMWPEYAGQKTRTQVVIDGIEIIVLPVAYSNAMSFAERAGAFLKFALEATAEARRHRADVVFATSTPLTIAVPGLAARVLGSAPMVFEVRDLWPELPIVMGALKNPMLQAVAKGLEWVAYHGAAQVVALSPGMADGVARRGIARDRITVIPNGCDVDKFERAADEVARFRAQMFPELATDQPLVVYAGTIGRMHEPGWLVSVARHMQDIDPDIRFALVGNGGVKASVSAQARDAGVLDQNLRMYDPVPKTAIPLLLRAASVATSTMFPVQELEHNSANKFFDALAAGAAVALNYGGWHAELISRYGAGLTLRHDDPRDAAVQLSALVRDSQRLASCQQGAKRLARAHFDRDDLAVRLETVLMRAVGR